MAETITPDEILKGHLTRLYSADIIQGLAPRLLELIETYRDSIPIPDRTEWDESDMVLITYADQVRADGDTSLAALRKFLVDHQLDQQINTVHLLPFFPYSSDDGFSVIDYKQVDPDSGTWKDVSDLGTRVNLAFDYVANHCSQQHEWFRKFLTEESPYDQFFIDVDPAIDLSQVVRPRALPLLTPFETPSGTKHVWTTFSPDQVDLNYQSPDLLLAMIDVLLFYVSQGARIVRLDAIAFLWKVVGTNCLHLEQTHEVVKLMRSVCEIVAPHVLILTETNVPHAENISYFGDADEAQMVYQFSLPPLLFDAFLTGDATTISGWMESLYDIPDGTTYFNFTASHDGIGVRPLEGIVPTERIDALVEATQERGGKVGMRTMPDGTKRPYELNVTYVDAMSCPGESLAQHARRFLSSQAIQLAMKGIPGIYFHSLVGTQNDLTGVEASGIPRRINRHKFERAELDAQISTNDSVSSLIFQGYRNLLDCRRQQTAFHPDGANEMIAVDNRSILAFKRTSPRSDQTILIMANVSDTPQTVTLASDLLSQHSFDLISQTERAAADRIELSPCETVWLTKPNS